MLEYFGATHKQFRISNLFDNGPDYPVPLMGSYHWVMGLAGNEIGRYSCYNVILISRK